MKRLVFFALFSFIIIYSSAADNELSKVVDALNKGDYPQMLKILPNVRDWSFNNPAVMLNDNAISSLFVLRDSLLVKGDTIPQIDSLVFFVIEELELLSEYFVSINNFEQAEMDIEYAMLCRLVIEGWNTAGNAWDWYEKGMINMKVGKYANAAGDFNESYQIRKALFGLYHPDVCFSLEAMVWANLKIGNYQHAISCLEELLGYYEHENGKESLQYITGLKSLSAQYFNSNNLPKAEYYYSEMLLWYDRKGDSISNDFLEAKSKLGCVYREMGQYDRALKILFEVYGKCASDTFSTNYIYTLVAIGFVYHKMRDYGNAEKYILLAKTYYEYAQTNGIQIEDIPFSNYLAMIAMLKHDNEKAEYYFLRDAEETLVKYGKSHPIYAQSLSNLGYFYGETQRYSEALDYHAKARMIYDERREFAEEEHWGYAITMHNMGVVYMYMKIYKFAAGFFKEYAQLTHDRYVNYMNFMSEQQLKDFLKSYKRPYEYWFPRVVYFGYLNSPELSTFAYDNELFIKGLLLNSSIAIRNSILESSDTILIRQWDDLTKMKQLIVSLEENAHISSYLAELREEVETLEKEITRNSAAFRQSQEQWKITWDSVQTHLFKNQVAVEYMVVPIGEDSTMYCALLLRDTCAYPIMIPLFEEKEVLCLVNTTNENKTSFTYSFDGNGEQLSNLIWSKVLPCVKQGETIYFAPSGLLHQLAIESLPYDSTHTMADVYNLVRLSSTREIVTRKGEVNHTTATLYGGIQYNMSGDELLAESEQYATSNLLASRGIESDTLDRGSVKYLPGTKTEVENINRMLKQNNLQVQLYTTTTANEESFKALSGKHQNILHIATHGFYWSDSTARKTDFFAERMMHMNDNMPTPPAIDPLNRCGLLFAGANTALQGHSNELPEGVQDGILTAKEISLLDLRDADLVVLSACETGKGEITGDGVFGLQRAFKQAGAQTIIMSLWPVNDSATQLFMTEFYSNWITEHQSKREAFRNAQNTVRSQYEEPVYWAGFVMLD